MRVLWWVPELPPDLGGIGTFAHELAPHFSRADVTYLVSRGPASRFDLHGVQVVRLPLYDEFRAGTPQSILRARRQVAELKREVAADLYHVHLSEPTPVLHASTASVQRGPTVVTLHNEVLDRLGSGEDTFLRQVLDGAPAVTTVSQAAATHLLAHLPHLEPRLTVIQNGIAVGPAPPPLPPHPTLLALGRLVPQKGFDLLLRAMPSVVERVPGVRLVVAGTGVDEASLHRLSGELGLEGHVHFLGLVPRDQVPDLLHAARVVVAPSRWEGLPYALLEAAERGRAIVTTTVGGNVEVVDHDVTGLALGLDAVEHDPTRLSEAIVRSLTEPDLADRLGAAARQRVLDRFDIALTARRYEDLYDHVLADR